MQPEHAGGGLDAQADIAAAPGQVERKLGTVAAVDTEGASPAVQGTVEELAAVLDDEVLALGTVAQRPRHLPVQVRTRHLDARFVGLRLRPARSRGERRERQQHASRQDGHASLPHVIVSPALFRQIIRDVLVLHRLSAANSHWRDRVKKNEQNLEENIPVFVLPRGKHERASVWTLK